MGQPAKGGCLCPADTTCLENSKMPVKETASPEAATPQKSKTYTNWKAFEQAKLAPASIKCEGYRPVFMHDSGCHSNMLFKTEDFIRHIEGEHGGGFRFFLKPNDGKTHPLWAQLEEAGLEAHDFRCEICDQTLRFSPNSFVPHLKAHSGKTRRVKLGSTFNILIGKAKPTSEEYDNEVTE